MKHEDIKKHLLQNPEVREEYDKLKKKIGSKIPVLGGPKGKIKLDPQNEDHKDWYEEEGEN